MLFILPSIHSSSVLQRCLVNKQPGKYTQNVSVKLYTKFKQYKIYTKFKQH